MNIAFLASHRGSNMQVVLDACREKRLHARPCLLVCNNSNAEALHKARSESIPCFVLNGTTHPSPSDLDSAMLDVLQQHNAELILLAGYLKRIGPAVVAAYRDRILNIHPALLPKYGGRGMYGPRVHEAVLAAHDRETGVTIHLVDEEYDHGAILAQCRVPVLSGDTVDSLSSRVLHREHEFLVETLDRIAHKQIVLPCRKEND